VNFIQVALLSILNLNNQIKARLKLALIDDNR